MNSLRSNSISCRFACLAFAIQESKKIPIIVHPLKTSSCGMFSRSLFAVWSSWTSQASKLVTALRATCFLEFNSRKHSARRGIYRKYDFLKQYWVSDCRMQSEQRNTKCCLSKASSLSDLKDLLFRPPRQDVFAPFFCFCFLSVAKENEKMAWYLQFSLYICKVKERN